MRSDGGLSIAPECQHIGRPDPGSVRLWERWKCPDCGCEWVADEPAPQMLTDWIPAESWAWLPNFAEGRSSRRAELTSRCPSTPPRTL